MHSLFHGLPHRLFVVQFRLLFEEPYGVAGSKDRLAVELLIHTRQDPEKGAFPRSVQAENTDLRSIKIGEVDILQYRLFVVILAYPDHGVNDLIRFVAHRYTHPLYERFNLHDLKYIIITLPSGIDAPAVRPFLSQSVVE